MSELYRCPQCKEQFVPEREGDIYCPMCDPRLETPADLIWREE